MSEVPNTIASWITVFSNHFKLISHVQLVSELLGRIWTLVLNALNLETGSDLPCLVHSRMFNSELAPRTTWQPPSGIP